MEINTNAGKTYTVVSASGCTVSTSDGTAIKELAAGQDYFTAISGKTVISDDSAECVEVFKLAPYQKLRLLGVVGGDDNGGLPAGYTRVKYLQSVAEADADGNVNWQYFRITEDGSSYTRIFVEAENYRTDGAALVFVAGVLGFLCNINHWRLDWRGLYNYFRENVAHVTADFYLKGITKCIFNGTEYELIEGTGNLDWAGNPMPIENITFMGRTYGDTRWHKGIRLYKAEIYTEEGCIHQLLPCLDETGTPCMYDVITKTPYYNQGTGDFTYA